jgi:hypothetical protein
MRRTKGKIIVSGILFWYPLAGVTYQFLHYLIGLRQLGYDPYYVEDSARWIYDPRLNDISADARGNIKTVSSVLEQHGFRDRWAFRGRFGDEECYGMSESQLGALYHDADAFLNVTGSQEIYDEHRRIKRRLYIESDPFPAQVKAEMGDESQIKKLSDHDTLFTFGENVGKADCLLPTGGFNWLPTRQPVALELWQGAATGGDTFNTITTWHNKGKNVEWRGETWYWTKDREFKKFLEIPHRRPSTKFELAAGVDEESKVLLNKHSWLQRDSFEVSRDTAAYRNYIQGARGEFTVARDQYVRPNTGWFSDRTACYLAAGRPVITQETGFSKFIPIGRGLFGFKTMEDILQAVDAIESDYPGNCRAARDIAAEYFCAERVVGSLMARAGL